VRSCDSDPVGNLLRVMAVSRDEDWCVLIGLFDAGAVEKPADR
jgi:hypothetical protein